MPCLFLSFVANFPRGLVRVLSGESRGQGQPGGRNEGRVGGGGKISPGGSKRRGGSLSSGMAQSARLIYFEAINVAASHEGHEGKRNGCRVVSSFSRWVRLLATISGVTYLG